MGAALCEKMGFSYTIVYESREETTEHDTVAAAEIMTEKGVDPVSYTHLDVYKRQG